MSESSEAAGDRERRAITARAGIVAVGTLLSRFLGLARDIVLAAVFFTAETDAFWVAFTLPNSLRQLLAEGAVSSAVVPVLAEVRKRGGDGEAQAFFAKIRGLSLVALVVTSVLGVLLAPWLVDLYAHGFSERPGEMERTVTLTRWVFPYIFFMGSAALGMAALHTKGRFVVASFAPALLNVALVAASFGLPAWLGASGQDRVLALAFGALAGGLLQVVAQMPSLAAIGYGGLPRLDLSDPDVRSVLRRIAPMTLGLGIYHVDLIVCRRFLSGMGEGAQSWFSWAQRLCDFPQGIFVMALSAATLPSLSALVAEGKREEVEKTFAFAMRLSLFVGIPVTALFAALGEPIIVAIFQRGHFDARSAHETARSLMAQGAGIWAVAAVRTLVSVFFALGDTRTPVVVSALDVVALIVAAVLLAGPMGHAGIGVAVSISSVVQMALLWGMLGRHLRDRRTGEILVSALKTTAAATGAGGLSWWVAREVAAAVPASAAFRIAPAVAGGAVFGGVFLLLAGALRSSELSILGGGLARRLRRRRA